MGRLSAPRRGRSIHEKHCGKSGSGGRCRRDPRVAGIARLCGAKGRWRRSRRRAPPAARIPCPPVRLPPAVFRQHALHQHDLSLAAAPVSGQPGARATHQESGQVERPFDGRSRQQAERRDRRPHLDFRVGGDVVRDRLQPFLQGAGYRLRGRRHLLPGTRRPGHLRARVSRGPADGEAPRELPSRTAGRWRAVFVPSPVADARVLGIPDGVDGAGPDHVDLPGALHAPPGRSRPGADCEPKGLGVPRRRRDRRARDARCDLAGLA